jgi:hypothetical protein
MDFSLYGWYTYMLIRVCAPLQKHFISFAEGSRFFKSGCIYNVLTKLNRLDTPRVSMR